MVIHGSITGLFVDSIDRITRCMRRLLVGSIAPDILIVHLIDAPDSGRTVHTPYVAHWLRALLLRDIIVSGLLSLSYSS